MKSEASVLPDAPAIFVDCGGTLVIQAPEPVRGSSFAFVRGAGRALGELAQASYRNVLFVNPSDVQKRNSAQTVFGIPISEFYEALDSREFRFDYVCGPLVEDAIRTATGVSQDRRESARARSAAAAIGKAVSELRIDLKRSWMIGDETFDIETAREAGLKSILVQAGKAGLDGNADVVRDFSATDLREALNFILHRYTKLCSYCATFVAPIRRGALIGIGGNSKSGKPIFASVLKVVIEQAGFRTWIVPIDSWLLDKSARTPTVLGRYYLEGLNDVVRSLLSRGAALSISLRGYDKLKQCRTGEYSRIVVQAEDVVILEGTIALALSPESQTAIHRIFVIIPEAERRRRVVREYILRGKTEGEAHQICAQRVADEVPIVLDSSSRSTRVDFLC